MKKILFPLTITITLILLFSHPSEVAAGCTRGLMLWYRSVLPAILPFMFFSGLLINTGAFQYINRLYAPILRHIFRISPNGCYAILMGFFCGFPMGAKVIADLVRENHISEKEGEYLLGFCNNVSPAFFLNYICMEKSGFQSVPWKLVLFFYGVPLLYGLITRPFYHFTCTDGTAQKQASLHRLTFPMLDACIMDSFAAITRLGGYIILFSIIVQLISLLPLSPTVLAFVSGALEISCGSEALSLLFPKGALRTTLLCTFATFGGFCICAQTQSVLEGTSLHITTWLRGRMITSLLIILLLPLLLSVG